MGLGGIETGRWWKSGEEMETKKGRREKERGKGGRIEKEGEERRKRIEEVKGEEIGREGEGKKDGPRPQAFSGFPGQT